MRIFVARHGETDWNAENIVCGRTDLPLNENGLLQAEELAANAMGRGIEVILVSPMRRAQQTAAIVSEALGLPVFVDERLIEQDYGAFEGTSRFGEEFLRNKRQFAVRYPGGESHMMLAHRLYGLLDDIREKYAGKTVLLVCHGGVARVIRTYFQDMTNEEFFHYGMGNAALEMYTV